MFVAYKSFCEILSERFPLRFYATVYGLLSSYVRSSFILIISSLDIGDRRFGLLSSSNTVLALSDILGEPIPIELR